jgi:hypothetical protein
MLAPGDKGTCPVCGATVTMTHGGLRRHKGTQPFDVATDGICSGSHGPAVEGGMTAVMRQMANRPQLPDQTLATDHRPTQSVVAANQQGSNSGT